MSASTLSPSPEATSTAPLNQHYMPALTGIRALAAYMVCFFHYNPFGHSPHASGWHQLAFGFFNELHTGVTIFFVLSGFLICYRYYDTTSQVSWPWFKRYFRNRFARIYPMYFLLTLLAFGLIEWDADRYEMVKGYSQQPIYERLVTFFLNLTLLKGFFNSYKFTGIAQGWSLTVEECFYAGAPFFILAFRRSRLAFLLLPAATLLLAFGLWQTLGRLHFHGLFSSGFFVFNFTFFGRCLEFFVGMGLAVLVLRQRRAGLLPTRRGGWFTTGSLVGFVAILVVMDLIYIHPSLVRIVDGADFNGNSKDTYYGLLLNNAVLPVFIALLFYGLLTEHTWLRSLLSTRLLDLLGKSSYIFYLIHTGVVNVLLRTYLAHNALLQFVLLNVLAILLYKFVEAPLHRWLKPA